MCRRQTIKLSQFFITADLNDVRFSAYRTAMKIRTLQKKLCCKSTYKLPYDGLKNLLKSLLKLSSALFYGGPTENINKIK